MLHYITSKTQGLFWKHNNATIIAPQNLMVMLQYHETLIDTFPRAFLTTALPLGDLLHP